VEDKGKNKNRKECNAVYDSLKVDINNDLDLDDLIGFGVIR
jgi:hypothetical protein